MVLIARQLYIRLPSRISQATLYIKAARVVSRRIYLIGEPRKLPLGGRSENALEVRRHKSRGKARRKRLPPARHPQTAPKQEGVGNNTRFDRAVGLMTSTNQGVMAGYNVACRPTRRLRRKGVQR